MRAGIKLMDISTEEILREFKRTSRKAHSKDIEA
jgi:hypothetical protein